MITKKGKTHAFDDAVEDEAMMTEGAPKEGAPEKMVASETETESAGEETGTLSLEMFGGKVNPGDVVSLEVVDVDPDSGTLSVKYRNPAAKGIKKAVAAFDEGV